MDDLDSLFEGEMASINEMFQEFEIKDKQNKKRRDLEQEEGLKRKSIPTVDATLPKVSLEDISRRRSQEAAVLEKQWKEEMEALDRESRQAQQTSLADDTDIVLQNLDDELQSLIKSKEEDVKITQKEKELYAQRQKEEKERKERERLERLAQQKDQHSEVQEMTIEEWIAWMEEKKKKGMSQEQLEEYERRKAARQKIEKEREEKMKREEEEKKVKTRDKIEKEIRSYRMRSEEVAGSRLTDDKIRQNFEDMARKNEEDSRVRREKGVRMREEKKQQDLEDLKPKARSALAARWEESVKAKNAGGKEEHRATVVTRAKTTDEEILEREEERLTRRISGHFPNGAVKLSPEKKRHSSYQPTS